MRKNALFMLAFVSGKAEVLSKTLAEHFECFGKPRAQIRAIDDELCHHSPSSFWQLKVWPIADTENLELEWVKMICLKNALPSPDGGGLNESIKFTHHDNWLSFKQWFFPPSNSNK